MIANGIPRDLSTDAARLLATIDQCLALWRKISAQRAKAGQPETPAASAP
jgi:hypothetical protein